MTDPDQVELEHATDVALAAEREVPPLERVRRLWRQGPIKILTMLAVALLANFGISAWSVEKLASEPANNCETLAGAVGKVRLLVDLVLVRAPADSTSPLVIDLRKAMAPGGELEIPPC